MGDLQWLGRCMGNLSILRGRLMVDLFASNGKVYGRISRNELGAIWTSSQLSVKRLMGDSEESAPWKTEIVVD